MNADVINQMLEARVKDLAARGPAGDREASKIALLKALGLSPLPKRTELNAEITGVIQREGYRLEKLRYESRPGLLVTAHLYIPDGDGPFPVILNPHGHFQYKKFTPVVQARGISLALEGFAALIVDSPGGSWDHNPQNERDAIGEHNDWFLNMGISVQGVYAWDLVRGLDYLETRKDMDCTRVGITGTSGGGTATMYTFAVDERIACAVPVCYATSLEVNPHNGCLCNHVPGALNLGDRSDILALRAPAPVMLIGASVDGEFPPAGHKKTYEKLHSIYRSKRAENNVRLEICESEHDYNRRMREAMVAFFREHLLGEPKRQHVAEKRPLTDGQCNPYEAGTAKFDDPELVVVPFDERQTRSFRDLLAEGMREPVATPFHAGDRLVGWGRYGKLKNLPTGTTIVIRDEGLEGEGLELPTESISQRLCIYLGLSVPEVFAQLLHTNLPGGPEGWESTGVASLTGDALSSMIASVKTLVSSGTPETAPTSLVATGPIASMTAQFLKLYRPSLQVETSHSFTGWEDALNLDIRQLVQPSGRYLEWPFKPAT